MFYYFYDSPVGQLLLTGETHLETLNFPTGKTRPEPAADWILSREKFAQVVLQLDQYFKGERKTFDLELHLKGTPFQKQVWQELVKIPYGQTISYGELAHRIGNSKASRAVGMANGKNPVSIIVPCHRVIGKKGDLTGFGGGLAVKKKLLELEKGKKGLI
jgi:methylated-DNA-[protein]-cysteine S-methyltransferase